jgi:hypothetical protein
MWAPEQKPTSPIQAERVASNSLFSQERAKKGGSLDLGSTARVAHRRNTSRAYQRCTRSTFPFSLKDVPRGVFLDTRELARRIQPISGLNK